MAVRAEVRGELLAWARERSAIGFDELVARFPKLAEWEGGESSPTLKQLEQFAQATHTPVGLLFLKNPPEEQLPIPDFRTIGGERVGRPSPDLLETISLCQQRQEWFRDFAQANREDPVALVGTATTSMEIRTVAAKVRSDLDFNVSNRGATWSDALRRLSEAAEANGILVMVSGIVGSNTHRKLDPHEFRGFALVDTLAPVIFVNGADTKSAQIFTLAHEVMHVALGGSALSDADIASNATHDVERWCNGVASEFLVPLDELTSIYDRIRPKTAALEVLARHFKVSTLVVLRRIFDGGYMSWDDFRAAYRSELSRVLTLIGESGGSGGNFYNTQPVRVSKRFARAVIASTLEGDTLRRDALQMLGFRKQSTFNELAQRLGVA
jgi:Zn-dependent peptidase ImmA (M78 family)/transcriptional regulator with XRE-family HTH domain